MKARSVRSGVDGRRRCVGLLVASLFLVTVPTRGHAAIKEIDAHATYHLGDNDSKLDGHRLALLEAKRSALEKAGTYVESITEVKDYQLTRDDIKTYSAGILHVEETKDPEWQMEGHNLEVTVYVKVSVDDDDVARKIGALRKDQDATQQLKESRTQVEQNEHKVAEINRQLKKTKKGSAASQRAQAQRTEALQGIDSSTLKAQAAVAEKFSIQAYSKARDYMERQIPAIKGCFHSSPSSSSAADTPAGADRGLALLAVPPLVLLVGRPRKRNADHAEREDT
jgi:hypothetical protein